MSLSSPDTTPPTEVPEADWAEQAVAADPLADAEAQPNAVPANRRTHHLRSEVG